MLDSCALCFATLTLGPDALCVGVTPCTLIMGGAEVVDELAGPASSAFFPATEAMVACLGLDREPGGGLFSRGEAGHCGVVSPELGPALFGPPRVGSFDTASVTAPPPVEICGTLLADNALCIAAAEGCVEKDWLAKGPGRLSLRMGDVFREDLGLAVAEGDDDDGNNEVELCLRS